MAEKLKSSQEFKDFIDAYEHAEIQITSKVRYKVRDVIEKNDQLFHGKFEYPKDGDFTKIFYNIGFIVFRTIYQNSVINLKDMLFRSLNGKGIKVLALLKLAVFSYLKRIKFDSFLNDLRYFIKDGTTYVKIVNGVPEVVNNHNIIRPAYGGSVQETGIGEKCFYTWDDMLSNKEAWKDQWERIESIKELMKKEQIKDFIIYEYWNVHEFEVNGEKEWHKGCIKYLDIKFAEAEERARNQSPDEWQPYIELERFVTPHTKKRTSKRLTKKLGPEEELYPYKELHFIKVPQRTLGFSVFELIKGIQEAYNRKMNLGDKKDILGLTGLFKHKKHLESSSIAQQLLNNIQSGTVIEMDVDEDLERLVVDTKTGELINNVDKLLEIAFQIVGVNVHGAGEPLPASMPATTSVINQRVQQTTYDYAINQMASFLSELFDDFYLETVFEELDYEDISAVIGDPRDFEELDKYFSEQFVYRRIYLTRKYTGLIGAYLEPIEDEDKKDEAEVGGIIKRNQDKVTLLNSDEEVQQLVEQYMLELAENDDTRWADFRKEFIKNLNYSFEFYVNNDTFDKNVKITNLLSLRQNSDLSTKKIDMAIIDLMNENPKQFEKTEEEKAEEMEMLRMRTNIENESFPAPVAATPERAGVEAGVSNRAL